MKYVDLSEYREPGFSLYWGSSRGTAVRDATRLDESDAKEEKVTIIVPDDVFAVTASFLSGFLAKSIRTHGKERFRELFKFEGKSLDETLDMVIDGGARSALGPRRWRGRLESTSGVRSSYPAVATPSQ